jgi:hypothetical protein
MDSLSSYVANARTGGAAGEIIVREGLTWALRELGVTVIVADSDEAMERLAGSSGAAEGFDLFFFDPWTVTDRELRLRPFLAGREGSLFILSFFGWAPGAHGLSSIPQSHVLTAYPENYAQASPSSTFLGFIVERNPYALSADAKNKSKVGVVWGKRAVYFEGREAMLDGLSRDEELGVQLNFVSNMEPGRVGPRSVFHGALDREEWLSLLAQSRFLLGLGNPLLGPSAMDALAAGAMYLDPSYDGRSTKALTSDVSPRFSSQHPYLRKHVGEPYVCVVDDVTRLESVAKCVRKALETPLEPFVDPSFTRAALLKRVKGLLEGFSRRV